MNAIALTMMLFTQISVACITFYYFLKVLKSPKKTEPDSYIENDESAK
jgi:hypothetical protein